jgi:23S rRNA (cytidine1920-2'-O)/16S rRNA (cytidine1409-2'-O)-methyltransferase
VSATVTTSRRPARQRLDALLADRDLAASREKAQALILAGLVTVDGQVARKAAQLVNVDATIVLRESEPYVSRGGYKLAHALDRFGVSVDGLLAVDVGASTGGFTDVLLQRGARRVYAVDVGHGQLHWRLRNDARVVVLERTNARTLEALPELADLATIDVSFISLRLVLPSVRRLVRPGSSMIALVKPQFEAGRELVGRGGVVRSSAVHRLVLEAFVSWLPTEELGLAGLIASPLRGPAGNVEFLALLKDRELPAAEPEGAIERALAEAPLGDDVRDVH